MVPPRFASMPMPHDPRATITSASPACDAACPVTPPAIRLEDADAVLTSRRGFLTQSMLAAATLALAACGFGPDVITSPTSIGGTVNVNDYATLATVGGVALVKVNGTPLAIVRTGSDSFLALSRICPHQGATVSQTTTGFKCPRHGARFSTTGTWTGGEQTNSLRSYATTYDAATGALTIA